MFLQPKQPHQPEQPEGFADMEALSLIRSILPPVPDAQRSSGSVSSFAKV
ncbi:hypothetical protein RISK_004855 [Rhodopirellula islandica]|uniref:Uncharacterized protein n=1 Tax=Rhodopirellula islandica TaxID=595434 RepID=A0A0J1EBX8_RHOIS|nr:hypothetical protein RISK_004855 [Rhodopirellula islandica]